MHRNQTCTYRHRGMERIERLHHPFFRGACVGAILVVPFWALIVHWLL